MSHFTKIKTKLYNLEILKKSLEDLSLKTEFESKEIRGYNDQTHVAELVIKQMNNHDIGFTWNGSEYELVTDLMFWAKNMKKTLLSSLALVTVLSVNAQDYVHSKGFQEDFLDAAKTEDPASNRESFWYGCGVTTLSTDAECNDVDHQLTRNGDGDLTITTYKPNSAGNWAPVGFSLSNPGKDEVVDISSTNKVSVSYTNTSDNTLEVYWTFTSKDSPSADQKLVMANSSGVSLGGVVAAGATVSADFQLNTGTRTSWSLSSEVCEDDKDGIFSGGKCVWDDGFDPTKLFAVEIAITGLATAETSWAPAALDGETVVFHSISGGEAPPVTEDPDDTDSTDSTDNVENVQNLIASGLNIFPNPAIDVLNVKFDASSATTIQLVDITGKVIDTQLTQAGSVTTSFATAEMNSGVYFVNFKNELGSTTRKVIVK
jgi:hypothetical protein